MHVAPEVHIEWVDDEAVVLNSETGELHYLNVAAALALALIAEHGLEGAAAEVKTKYSDDAQRAEAEFSELVQEMVDKGLLVE